MMGVKLAICLFTCFYCLNGFINSLSNIATPKVQKAAPPVAASSQTAADSTPEGSPLGALGSKISGAIETANSKFDPETAAATFDILDSLVVIIERVEKLLISAIGGSTAQNGEQIAKMDAVIEGMKTVIGLAKTTNNIRAGANVAAQFTTAATQTRRLGSDEDDTDSGPKSKSSSESDSSDENGGGDETNEASEEENGDPEERRRLAKEKQDEINFGSVYETELIL